MIREEMIGEENEFETIGTSSGHRKLRDGREAHHFPESVWVLVLQLTKTKMPFPSLPSSSFCPPRLQSEELERLMSLHRW